MERADRLEPQVVFGCAAIMPLALPFHLECFAPAAGLFIFLLVEFVRGWLSPVSAEAAYSMVADTLNVFTLAKANVTSE